MASVIRDTFVSASTPKWPSILSKTASQDTSKGNTIIINQVNDVTLPGYVMKSSEDPRTVFSTYKIVYLIPGETYRWSGLQITDPNFTLDGNGAHVILSGTGPIIKIVGANGSSYHKNMEVVIRNVRFFGAEGSISRTEDMTLEFEKHSAIHSFNAYNVTITGCEFERFKGACLYMYDDKDYANSKNWHQRHIITGNKFVSSRIGICNSGACEYSIASLNTFNDCQIAFYVIGGNWNRVGNLIVNSRCAYYHAKTGMWYYGDSGNFNAAHGTFTDNTANHCDYGGNKWPNTFKQQSGTNVTLYGFYYNDDTRYPPTFVGNTMYYCDMYIGDFSTGETAFCVVGCTIMGKSSSAPDSGCIRVKSSVKNKVWFIGCSGNGVSSYGVNTANCTPATFLNNKGENSVNHREGGEMVISLNEDEPLDEEEPVDEDFGEAFSGAARKVEDCGPPKRKRCCCCGEIKEA
uniref:LH3 n=1 Tax=Zoothera dauma adenovirus TaxID=3073259 RepID=A0AA51NPQ0_9ADEN|nr:LH3 [Zoothera dauma adenovirus]